MLRVEAKARLANLEAVSELKSNEQTVQELRGILDMVNLATELTGESADNLPATWQDTITTQNAEIMEELTGLKDQLEDQLDKLEG